MSRCLGSDFSFFSHIPLKIDPWNFGDSSWKPSFLGGLGDYVSFREGNQNIQNQDPTLAAFSPMC